MSDLLPEDVLVNIIGRLAPRYLAISRCVCKTWCTTIDAHNLLRMDLLPHSVSGLFINFNELSMSEFLSRPSKGPAISGKFDYLPSAGQVIDHCNGLILLYECVVNPATRQWALLPPRPSPNMPEHFCHGMYLVFDPTLSSHYEVFLIPQVSYNSNLDPAIEELEWPPSPCIVQVLSSRTKLWEERLFVREGEAAGNVADIRLDFQAVQENAVYWRGVLYVNYQSKFIMRISLSNDKYQVIKPPVDFEWFEFENESRLSKNLYLGKSEKGVYCALRYPSTVSFSIYILDESDGKTEWIMKPHYYLGSQGIDGPGPWTLQDINYNWDTQYEDSMEEKFEWDSDSDNVVENRSNGGYPCLPRIELLGFHPYKDVVFLSDTLRRGLAYHLDSSKIQDLGNLHPTYYGTEQGIQPFLLTAFPYTPWRGWFPEDT